MAYDKVIDSAFLEAGLTLVGDSIRAKGGTSAKLEFPNGMKAAVEAIDTSKPEQTKTATPSLSQQTISPDSGKVLSEVTINPITAALLTSLDSDFKAANIAEGVNLFGVTGTMQAGGQMANGTINISATYDANTYIYAYSFSITGLSFKPQRVFMICTDRLDEEYVTLDWMEVVASACYIDLITGDCNYVSEVLREEGLLPYGTVFRNGNYAHFFTVLNDGFACAADAQDGTDLLLRGNYQWYAFG